MDMKVTHARGNLVLYEDTHQVDQIETVKFL